MLNGVHIVNMKMNIMWIKILGQLSVKDVESYHQWKYTAENGAELLLASSPYDAIIIADKAECFVSVHTEHYTTGG